MKNVLKNTGIVVFTSGFNLFVATVLGLVLSLYLNYDNYAYYKLYCLYITFVGFAHFGFINGIYLEFGKYDYSDLPYNKFHDYLKMLVYLQIIVVLCAIPLICVGTNLIGKKLVLIFVFLNLPIINVNCFFSLINQFTKRFIYDSVAGICKGILDLLLMIFLIMQVFDTYIQILIFILFENIFSLVINIIYNKEIVFARRCEKRKLLKVCIRYIGNGFFIMISEFIGLIILGIDGLFVEHIFDLKEFAIYSFATTVITVFYSLMGTISNLIYPYLVRVENVHYSKYYNLLSEIILIVSGITLNVVYIICDIIEVVLPDYAESNRIIIVLALTLPFKAMIVLICNNYFKALKLSKDFFFSNLFALICSVGFNFISVNLYNDSVSLAVASVIAIILWYIVLEMYFFKKLENSIRLVYKKYLYMMVLLAGYFITVLYNRIASIFYFLSAIVIAFILFSSDFREVRRK